MYEDPRPPRSLNKAIPPELETIVLKAVGKLPAERYDTAGDFAEDLRRFLRHEPILARRATPVQRGRKWLRRHPSAFVTGIVLLVLLAVGSFASAWLIRGAYQRESQRAREAEERFQLARRSVDEMIQLAEQELADKPHLENLRKRLLEAALTYYQEFIEQRRGDPDAQGELEATSDRVRKILGDLAVLQGAGQLLLLNDAAVLDDLRLSGEQREQLADLLQRMEEQRGERFGRFHRLSPEERRDRFLELARSNEAAVAKILSPEQLGRLRQIALQFQGPMAFREPEVAAALKLTAKQREQMGAIEADLFFDKEDCHAGSSPAGPPARRHEAVPKAAVERMLAVLTEEQAKRWKEMTGEPFVGPTLPFRPGPHGHFGPPPHFRPGARGPFGPPH
jgi:hypothetical protein